MIDSLVCPFFQWAWNEEYSARSVCDVFDWNQVKRFALHCLSFWSFLFPFFLHLSRFILDLIGFRWLVSPPNETSMFGSRFHDLTFDSNWHTVYTHLLPMQRNQIGPIRFVFPGNYGFNAMDFAFFFDAISGNIGVVYSNNCNWFNQAIDLSIVGCNQWFQALQLTAAKLHSGIYHFSGSICIRIFTSFDST